jgi:tetratricopeptide (TPR) repeat protein
MRGIVIFLILFLSFIRSSGQGHDEKWYLVQDVNYGSLSDYDKHLLDSALAHYHNTNNDSVQLYCLNYISEKLEDPQLWPKYSKLIIERAKNPNTPYKIKVFATANNNLGLFEFNSGNVEPALKYFAISLHLDSLQHNYMNMPNTLMNMGYVMEKTGDIRAAEYFNTCIKIAEKINDVEIAGRAKSTMAGIYFLLGEDATGLKLSMEAILSLKKINSRVALASAYNNLGNYYHNKHNYDRAYYFYVKALEIRDRVNDKDGVISNLNNIGSIYLERKEYDKAKKNYDEALKLSEELGNELVVAYTHDNISSYYQRLKDDKNAEKHSLITYRIGEKLSSPELVSRASDYLYAIYSRKKDYKNALHMLEMYNRMSKKMNGQAAQKEIYKQQFKTEFEKKSAEVKAKAESEKERIKIQNREEKRIQNIITISVGGGFILVLVLAIVIFRNLQQNKKKNTIILEQKKLVEEKQKEVMDSIKYARRIQQSLMPTEKYIERNLKK